MSAPDSSPARALAPSRQAREERGPLPAVLTYQQVLESSSKCFFSLTGLPRPLGFPTFPPPTRVVFASFLQKTKNCFRSALAADLHQPSSSCCLRAAGTKGLAGAGGGVGRGGVGGWSPGSEGRGGQAGPGPHRRREVMSKQVIIMRWALQKLTRLSRRSVTHSSASRYSRESSSRTCSRSTAKKERPDGDVQGRGLGGALPPSPRPGTALDCCLPRLMQRIPSFCAGGPHLSDIYTSVYFRLFPSGLRNLTLSLGTSCLHTRPGASGNDEAKSIITKIACAQKTR